MYVDPFRGIVSPSAEIYESPKGTNTFEPVQTVFKNKEKSEIEKKDKSKLQSYAGYGIGAGVAYAGYNLIPTALSKGGTKADFWYRTTKSLENTQALGPLSPVFNIFTRTAYGSSVMSAYRSREGEEYLLDVSKAKLGTRGRYESLKMLNEFFGVKDKDISNFDFISVKDGNIRGVKANYSIGSSTPVFEVVDKILNTKKVSVMDSGRLSKAIMTDLIPETGIVSPATGKRLVDRMVGVNEGVALLPEDFGPELFKKNRKGLGLAAGYSAMALQRTSYLIDEMFNLAKEAVELLGPEGKGQEFYDATLRRGKRHGLFPAFNHGNSSSMLMRYTGFATKAFFGLAAVNQAGTMLQSDNFLANIGGAGLQAGILAYAGQKLEKGLLHDSKLIKPIKGKLAMFGAIAGASGIVPISPLSDGLLGGGANIVSVLQQAKSSVTEALFLNDIKREIEEFAPGATKPTTALAMGILGGTAYTLGRRYLKKEDNLSNTLRYKMLSQFDDIPSISEIAERFDNQDAQNMLRATGKFKDSQIEKFGEEVFRYREYLAGNEATPQSIREVDAAIAAGKTGGDVPKIKYKKGSPTKLVNEYQPGVRLKAKANLLAEEITNHSFERVRDEIMQEKGIFKKIGMIIDKAPVFKAIGYASGTAALGWGALTFQFASLDDPGTIAAKNRGELLEEVRKAQKWEMGNEKYEGGDISYFRPNWIARMRNNVIQKGSSGRGMLEEWVLKNFTYQLEKESYYDKPVPITSAAFEDVPFIYPLIKPIADLIKRPKLMHVGEWARTDNTGQVQLAEYMGAADKGDDSGKMMAPESPYTYGNVLSRTYRELTGLAGLTGFHARSLVDMLTVSSEAQPEILESYNNMINTAKRFYDLETGGSFAGIPLLSEPIRRFLVSPNRQDYNPIPNEMPDWMTSKYKVGNPVTAISGGEYRLPGKGFEALNPEVKGQDPQEYSQLHRMMVLSNVAHGSKKYEESRSIVEQQIEQGLYGAPGIGRYARAKEYERIAREKEVYERYKFNEDDYGTITGRITEYDPENLTFKIDSSNATFKVGGISNSSSDLIASYNMSLKEAAKRKRQNAREFKNKMRSIGSSRISVTTPQALDAAVNSDGTVNAGVKVGSMNLNKNLLETGGFAYQKSPWNDYFTSGRVQRTTGSMWENFTHKVGNITAPLEYMGPFGFSPMMKFMSPSDPLERYEEKAIYGDDVRLWQKPIEDWFAPAIRTALHDWAGLNFISPGLNKQRSIDATFDSMQYGKYSSLYYDANAAGAHSEARKYKRARENTIMGSHGFVDSESFRELIGGDESKYSFGLSSYQNDYNRERIMELLPENKKRHFRGQWAYRDFQALAKVQARGDRLSRSGEEFMGDIYRLRADEGYLRDRKSEKEFKKERYEGETYADFRRRQEMETSSYHDMDPNWVGFNPSVDLEDVKINYLQSHGYDLHNHNIYRNRTRFLSRKVRERNAYEEMMRQNNSFTQGQNAMMEVSRLMGVSSSQSSINSHSLIRQSSYISMNLTQQHQVSLANGDF